MRLRGSMLAGLLALLAGCGSFAVPPATRGGPSEQIESAAPTGAGSGEPLATPLDPQALLGPWQSSPFAPADSQIAIVSDACAAAARGQLGEAEADLPTAVVDARGEGFVTVILADETRAIECLLRVDAAGATSVDSVVRLAPSAIAAAHDRQIRLTTLLDLDDRQGGRSLVIGRVGTNAAGVKIRFRAGDVSASMAHGWYIAWWPVAPDAGIIAALDAAGGVVASIAPPAGAVDGRLGAASWWLDPNALAPTPESVVIEGLILEEACASGKSPQGRVEDPLIDLSETAVTVTFGIRPLAGDQDCQGNEPFPVSFRLPEPLADRTLLDGAEVPARDASKPPVG
jgi:hypothetical protein